MGQPAAARRLAHFAIGLALDDVPVTVTAAALRLTLDTLGNALAAAREDFGGAVLGVAERLGGPAESTLLGCPARRRTATTWSTRRS